MEENQSVMTPKWWLGTDKYKGIRIVDCDGWSRDEWKAQIPITEEEFGRRLERCTVERKEMVEVTKIEQPNHPGAVHVVEYEITINKGSAGIDLIVPGTRGVKHALDIFNHLTTTSRDGGYMNLIAWSGAAHEVAVGLILAQYAWEEDN